MKFHLTVKDNESGRIVHDIDCNAIVGALATENGTTNQLAIVHCTGEELFFVCKGAKDAADKAVEDNPKLKLMLMLSDVFGKKEKEENE